MAAGRAACGFVQCGAVAALVARIVAARQRLGAWRRRERRARRGRARRRRRRRRRRRPGGDGAWRALGRVRRPRARALRVHVGVALPSALCLWIEWWAFEALAVIVGRLKDPDSSSPRTARSSPSSRPCTRRSRGSRPALASAARSRARRDRPRRRRGGQRARAARARSAQLGARARRRGRARHAGALVAAGRRRAAHRRRAVRREPRTAWAAAVCVVPYAFTMTCFAAAAGAGRQRARSAGRLGYCVGLPPRGRSGPRASPWRGGPASLAGVWLGNAAALVIAACWVGCVVARLPLRTTERDPCASGACRAPGWPPRTAEKTLVAALLPESDGRSAADLCNERAPRRRRGRSRAAGNGR